MKANTRRPSDAVVPCNAQDNCTSEPATPKNLKVLQAGAPPVAPKVLVPGALALGRRGAVQRQAVQPRQLQGGHRNGSARKDMAYATAVSKTFLHMGALCQSWFTVNIYIYIADGTVAAVHVAQQLHTRRHLCDALTMPKSVSYLLKQEQPGRGVRHALVPDALIACNRLQAHLQEQEAVEVLSMHPSQERLHTPRPSMQINRHSPVAVKCAHRRFWM
jgi:hypothetical protein